MIRLALASLRYYWRTHLGVLLGTICAAAVLVGAMAVGDSVRLSLASQAAARIGGVDAALLGGDRKFSAALADRIGADLGHPVAPVLSIQGIARADEGNSKAGIVQVYGCDPRFFGFRPAGPVLPPPAPGKAYLNSRLAAQLDAQVGETILLRIEKPSLLPRDMLMATVDDISFALRLEVERVLTDDEFGRFGLRASQVPPFNVFLALDWLQGELDMAGRANMLLTGGAGKQGVADLVRRANEATQRQWTLTDAELRVRTHGGMDELTSVRVFIDRPVVDAVRRLDSGLLAILTYFVNDLESGDRKTPYSTVSALGPLEPEEPPADATLRGLAQLVPTDLGDDEVVITDWLAKDLGLQAQGPLKLSFFEMSTQLQLSTRTEAFRVRQVIPLRGPAADPTLMPEFPGLADSENCRDWEPGVPIDLQRIRDTDETYWDDHRGTPKAYVSLKRGVELFGNTYGDFTAIRGPLGFADRMRKELPKALAPRALGLAFQDLRTPTLATGTSATDFGGLFLGLSFFLIGAALLLTALLFGFGIGHRAKEIGTLLAVGIPPSRVRRLFLLESLFLAIAGSALGAWLGTGYTRGVLYGLDTMWRGAIGASTLSFHAPPGTILLGAGISILVAVATIALTLRKVFHHPALSLLQSRNGIPAEPTGAPPTSGRLSLTLGIGCPLLALGLAAVAGTTATQAAGLFFGAGALLLIGGLAWCRRLLIAWARSDRAGSEGAGLPGLTDLARRNAGRRTGRSLATVALLASGTFLVVAVQANRLKPPPDPSLRSSGTGGFALIGRSTLPVVRNLATTEGRDAFGLDAKDLADVSIVPLRVREGDDASCLNLSQAQNPRLLGVEPDALAKRGAFSFQATHPPASGEGSANPWSLLAADYGPGVVPAIGDAASITWALHKSVGDGLRYVDERGQEFEVKIVGAVADSILQGNLVVAESHLRERFPSASGHRMFLIDVIPEPPGPGGSRVDPGSGGNPVARVDRVDRVVQTLTTALQDIGLELTSTSDRLRAFQAVQNTYLLIFQVLGGLGLLLGSLGVGMVVLRNALERRSELALLAAVGFPPRRVRQLFFREHGLLLLLGLGVGTFAAVCAVLPGARDLSLGPMLWLVLAVAVSGGLWVALASGMATRGPLLAALKDE